MHSENSSKPIEEVREEMATVPADSRSNFKLRYYRRETGFDASHAKAARLVGNIPKGLGKPNWINPLSGWNKIQPLLR